MLLLVIVRTFNSRNPFELLGHETLQLRRAYEVSDQELEKQRLHEAQFILFI
jgi:hypothetical protein